MYFTPVGVPTKKAAANTPAFCKVPQHRAALSGSYSSSSVSSASFRPLTPPCAFTRLKYAFAPATICVPRNPATPDSALHEPILMLPGVTPGDCAKAGGRYKNEATKTIKAQLRKLKRKEWGNISAP